MMRITGGAIMLRLIKLRSEGTEGSGPRPRRPVAPVTLKVFTSSEHSSFFGCCLREHLHVGLYNEL